MKIRKCVICNNYTLELVHCNKPTIIPNPPKYSPEDKYADYRRKYKKEKGID